MKTPFNFMLSACVALMLSACGGSQTEKKTENEPAAPSSPAPAATQSGKTYRVAVEPLYPPFVYKEEGAAIVGFDVDLLNAIAKKEGFELNLVPHPWNSLLDSVNTGSADMIMGGITILEERKAKLDFTNPYFENEVVLLANAPSNIHNFADARGKNIAFKINSSHEVAAKKWLPEFRAQPAENIWQGVKSVINKESDAIIGDSGMLMYYANKYPNEKLTIVSNSSIPKEPNGFAVAKGNTELLNKLNKGLTAVQSDGTYDTLYQKWFGVKK